MTTNKDRLAKADSKKREAGLVQVKAWVPSELKHSLKCYAELLRGNKTVSEYTNEALK